MISPTPRHGLTPLTLRVVAFAVLALIAVACSGSVQHGSVAGSGPPPATSSASQVLLDTAWVRRRVWSPAGNEQRVTVFACDWWLYDGRGPFVGDRVH